jgi:hypothetical protein
LLAHIVGHLLRHYPSSDIDRVCRSQRHDHLDRSVRIGRLADCLREIKSRTTGRINNLKSRISFQRPERPMRASASRKLAEEDCALIASRTPFLE